MIIGISGYARSGKDTVADILVQNHGFKKIAFADKLREVLYKLDPIIALDIYNEYPKGLKGYVTVRNVIDHYSWDGYKEAEYVDEIRRLLQRLGTEAGRQILGEDIWVDALFNNLGSDWTNIVIPDMRFSNEARAVSSRGGLTWRVSRLGVTAVNAHASETALDYWDFDTVIQNDGTLKDLEFKVDKIMEIVKS